MKSYYYLHRISILISILNLFYILRGLEGGPERGPDGGPERGPDEGVQLLYPP
jgi:hypothetical protein